MFVRRFSVILCSIVLVAVSVFVINGLLFARGEEDGQSCFSAIPWTFKDDITLADGTVIGKVEVDSYLSGFCYDDSDADPYVGCYGSTEHYTQCTRSTDLMVNPPKTTTTCKGATYDDCRIGCR